MRAIKSTDYPPGIRLALPPVLFDSKHCLEPKRILK